MSSVLDKNLVYFFLLYGTCWKSQCYLTHHHILPILNRVLCEEGKNKVLKLDWNESVMFANRLFSLTHSISGICLARYALNKYKRFNNNDIENSFVQKDLTYKIDSIVLNNSISYSLIDIFVYVLRYDPKARPSSLIHHIGGLVGWILSKSSKYGALNWHYNIQIVERGTIFLSLNWIVSYLIDCLKNVQKRKLSNVTSNNAQNQRLLHLMKKFEKLQTILSLCFAISFLYIRLYAIPVNFFKSLRKYIKHKDEMNYSLSNKENIQIYGLLIIQVIFVSLSFFWSAKLVRKLAQIVGKQKRWR